MANQIIQGIKAYAKKPVMLFYTGSKAALLFNPEGHKFTKFGTLTVQQVKSGKMGNYDKTTGFSGASNASVEWIEYPCRFDRYLPIHIDGAEHFASMLEGGTNPIDAVLADYYNRELPEEFDSVVFSSWAAEVDPANITPLVEKPKSYIKLLNEIRRNIVNSGYAGDVMLFTSATAYSDIETELASSGLLHNSTLTAIIPAGKDLGNGKYDDAVEITVDVCKYNNLIIVEVPDSRMFTKYTMLDGKTPGQEDGGVMPAPDAQKIYMIAVPASNAAFCGFQHETTQIAVPSGYSYTEKDLRDMAAWKNGILGNGFYGTIGINQKANAFDANTRVIYDGHLFDNNKRSVFLFTTPVEGLPEQDDIEG